MKKLKIVMDQRVRSFIESHAKKSTSECMGWLIGFNDGKQLLVLGVVGTNSYVSRSVVHAESKPEVLLELSNTVPLNFGIIGMYHSHPVNVFHSKTDDATLRNFSAQVPHFLSVVTNRSETRFFQLIDEDVREVGVKLSSKVGVRRDDFRVVKFIFDMPEHDGRSPFAIASEVSSRLMEGYTSGQDVVDISSGADAMECELFVYDRGKKSIPEDALKSELENRLYFFIVRYLNTEPSVEVGNQSLVDVVRVLGVPLVFSPSSDYLAEREFWADCWLDVPDEDTAREWLSSSHPRA